MKVKTVFEISKKEIIKLIKDKFKIDGDINFIIEEETFKSGCNDEGNVYSKKHVFKGAKINNLNEK